jgi:hypothetical protein
VADRRRRSPPPLHSRKGRHIFKQHRCIMTRYAIYVPAHRPLAQDQLLLCSIQRLTRASGAG